ncbi:homing endonuclease associated repeat-containing protein [uncultured Ruminococcus sp.]|uniref:homing endonuclease associated repeat-containing protein n=1 Tax=uncultured Ruminococcus sp. TaxID=165186 RepID=UPI0029313263|nr:HNH endonuclease [uncultured Ruminococcus sp.]
MKFELNEYHRNVSDEELLEDVVRVANIYQKDTLTQEEYRVHGKFGLTTYYRRFGSWEKVLLLAGLVTKGHNFMYTFCDEDVISDVCRVAELLHKDTITRDDYAKLGKYHSSTVSRKYGGSWNNVLELCGMRLNVDRDITNKDLFEEIERMWVLLGRQPTSTDVNKGVSKYALNTFVRRFGGWRKALEAFVEYINNEEQDEADTLEEVDQSDNSETNTVAFESDLSYKHQTQREPNLRLRFLVMQRDNFKCCICGASPAKDPSVELHIDHIVPWSKGGETTMDNLQTLCSKCNLGKSDLL